MCLTNLKEIISIFIKINIVIITNNLNIRFYNFFQLHF